MPFDLRILDSLKPEPFTEMEKRCAGDIGEIPFQVTIEKFGVILEEAMDLFIRSGVSSMLRSGDVAVSLYTARGDLVTSSCGSYLYSVCGQHQIKYICRRWKKDPTVGIYPGDIFYANDPLYGGVHNADQFAFVPIFFEERLVAWASASCHQPETGASEPGGMSVNARSRHDEGMKLSPMKIGENFALREDLVEMMVNMVSRAPKMQKIDTRARVLACEQVRLRVEQFVRDKGADFLVGVFTKAIQDSAAATRQRIGQWKDGIFRGVVFSDHVGVDEGLVRCFCTLTKTGDQLVFDFTGTSPETPGPYNAFQHATIAHVAMYLYGFPFSDFPLSSGLWEAIDFVVPEGTCLNANPEAAVSNSVLVCSLATCLAHLTMSKLLCASGFVDFATAPFGNNGDAYVMAGRNQRGTFFSDILAYPLNSEGGGARHDRDGVDAWGFPWAPWGRGPDVEEEEDEKPHVHLFQKILKDSCGHGRYRGGAGITVAWVLAGVPSAVYQSIVKSSRVQSLQSFFGGYPPPTHPGIQVHGTDVLSLMESGSRDVPSDVYELVLDRKVSGEYRITTNVRPAAVFSEGDIFVGCSHGGVGYGDVLDREPEAVMADLRNEIISHWVAQNVYQVMYDEKTLVMDPGETQRRRALARQGRIDNGLPYDTFVKQWAALRPKSEILAYYGPWPDPSHAQSEQSPTLTGDRS